MKRFGGSLIIVGVLLGVLCVLGVCGCRKSQPVLPPDVISQFPVVGQAAQLAYSKGYDDKHMMERSRISYTSETSTSSLVKAIDGYLVGKGFVSTPGSGPKRDTVLLFYKRGPEGVTVSLRKAAPRRVQVRGEHFR